MFISRESDYAIRTVRALSQGELISVSDICEMELIPLSYAYKILKKLENAGLVESRRGAHGGYRLRRKTSEFTLFDIISAIDDELFLNECINKGFSCPLNSGGKHCGVHKELCRIQEVLVKALSEKPASELM